MKISVEFENHASPHAIRVLIYGTDAGKRAPGEVCEEIERAVNTNAALLTERDELRAALAGLLEVAWPNDDCTDSRTNRAIEQARAVLAKGRSV